jgi:hypothetical protein
MDAPADPQLHLVETLHSLKVEVASAQAALLVHVAECDRAEVWRATGHKSMSYWLAAHLGINTWMAARYVTASHGLERLPHIRRALEDGLLSVEQTVELTRFATPQNEQRMLAWAKDKATRVIRRRGDNAAKRLLKDVQQTDQSRFVEWWWDEDGSALWLQGKLPADQGAVVSKALERVGEQLAHEPLQGVDEAEAERKRNADALYTVCSQQIAGDADVDRATVTIHADLMALAHDEGSCEIQNGPSINPETARRLVCDGRLETVVYDGDTIVGVGRRSRSVPPKLFRALMKRDGCCAWRGCPHTRALQAHHIRHWAFGGLTDLPNLVLVCPLHHRFLHEYHWKIVLRDDGTKRWYFPGKGPPRGVWTAPLAA